MLIDDMVYGEELPPEGEEHMGDDGVVVCVIRSKSRSAAMFAALCATMPDPYEVTDVSSEECAA